MVKKIVIIGPESTGKSMLCQQLAVQYNTIWVKEYAREYLLQNGIQYTYEDLLTIAKGQIEAEELAIGHCSINPQAPSDSQQPTANSQLLFIDTDMYVMKVWCEFVFEKCYHWILNRIAERPYDLYLLCNIDLPWVKDELREYPGLREREILFRHYKEMVINQNVPWVEISGNYDERLNIAVTAVNSCLTTPAV